MFDRLFTHAVDADGLPLHLAVRDGRIAWLGAERPEGPARETIDLQGQLILPGLVDGHIHLDKSFVGDRWHPHQNAASLRERLAIEKRLLAAAPPIVERANALIALAASQGTVAMRSHVDVDATTGLANLHAVMEAREQWRERMHIQLVAFPQAGVISCPGTAEVLEEALALGVEVLGGIDPGTLDGASEAQLDLLFGLAERYDARLDIHLHEPGRQCAEQLNRIASRTLACGLQGRVAVSHAYGLGDLTPTALERSARQLADAGIAIMTNAPGNHAFPPVKFLHEAGVTLFSGNDNIQDAWWPYGNADMLQRAMLIGYRSGFYTDADLRLALNMATAAPAQVMGLEGYGLTEGREATFLVVQAPNAAAAVASAPCARRLVRHGHWAED